MFRALGFKLSRLSGWGFRVWGLRVYELPSPGVCRPQALDPNKPYLHPTTIQKKLPSTPPARSWSGPPPALCKAPAQRPPLCLVLSVTKNKEAACNEEQRSSKHRHHQPNDPHDLTPCTSCDSDCSPRGVRNGTELCTALCSDDKSHSTGKRSLHTADESPLYNTDYSSLGLQSLQMYRNKLKAPLYYNPVIIVTLETLI